MDGHQLTPMIAKPSYAIFVWQNEGVVTFSVIEDMTIGFAKKFYDYHKMFSGRSAVVFTFFRDYDLRNSDLLQAATRFMKGDYIRYDVDMYNLIVKVSKGLDKTTPVH